MTELKDVFWLLYVIAVILIVIAVMIYDQTKLHKKFIDIINAPDTRRYYYLVDKAHLIDWYNDPDIVIMDVLPYTNNGGTMYLVIYEKVDE